MKFLPSVFSKAHTVPSSHLMRMATNKVAVGMRSPHSNSYSVTYRCAGSSTKGWGRVPKGQFWDSCIREGGKGRSAHGKVHAAFERHVRQLGRE